MDIGKKIRLERIFDRVTHRTIIVPMDHGVSSGPLPGIVDIRETIAKVALGGANAALMHRGVVRWGHRGQGRDLGLIVHLSASTDLSPARHIKVLTTCVEDAIRLGADAVSIHVNIGNAAEGRMLGDFGAVASMAEQWGMPLLAMVYARGPSIDDEFAPQTIAHCVRVGVELGADIVKVPYTGDPASFSQAIAGCAIPVVIAGGPRKGTAKDLLKTAHDVCNAGGAGLSVGRKVFQSRNTIALLQALTAIVHRRASLEEAERILQPNQG